MLLDVSLYGFRSIIPYGKSICRILALNDLNETWLLIWVLKVNIVVATDSSFASTGNVSSLYPIVLECGLRPKFCLIKLELFKRLSCDGLGHEFIMLAE